MCDFFLQTQFLFSLMSDLLSINASPREQQQLQEDEEAHFQVSRSSKAGQFDQIWWLHLENQFRHKSVL